MYISHKMISAHVDLHVLSCDASGSGSDFIQQNIQSVTQIGNWLSLSALTRRN